MFTRISLTLKKGTVVLQLFGINFPPISEANATKTR
jgi:hypothetical protein